MKEFHRAIVFTKVPLQGYYRYKDVFQIFPADLENMPKSKMQKHHPNILEFWISEEDKKKATVPKEFSRLSELFTTTNATLKKQDKILGLLSTFSNNLFFRYTDTNGSWGMPVIKDDPGEEANQWSSIWCLPWFHFPDLPRQFTIKSFTDLKIPPVTRESHKKFYMYYPNLDQNTKSSIVLPETINLLFDSYFLLDSNKMAYLDAAIFYTTSAVELLESRKTLSLLSSFTAMETMVNLEYKNISAERCDKCGQPKFSIAKKFREYLSKYIGESENNKKKFNKYYALRSQIIHTGRQLKTEKLFADVSDDEHEEEIITRFEILQLGKLAIINWLLFDMKAKLGL